MARIRSIKPQMFDDPTLGAVSPLARWVFCGLLTQADRRGRLEDEPERLRLRLLGYDRDADMNALLTELESQRLIIRYRASDRRLIQIRTFEKHQYPHHREVESAFPAPNTEEISKASGLPQSSPRQASVEPNTSPSVPWCTGTTVNGTMGTEGRVPRARADIESPPNGHRGGAPIHDASHKQHVYCGRVCLHASQFGTFVRRRNTANADQEIRAWAIRVIDEWTTGSRKSDEPGDDFDFWRARYSERWPTADAKKPKPDTGNVPNAAETRERMRRQQAEWNEELARRAEKEQSQ